MSLKNPVTPPGIDPGTVQLVAQCLNHYATPGNNDGGNSMNWDYSLVSEQKVVHGACKQ